jgi:tRNA A-37 threonylcarbamoyl transferase component Bud32
MGKLGHGPKIYSHSAEHMEMAAAKGKPLWAGYTRGEDEPVMNAAQARKASAAIRDLHKMGYAHGDLHALQFIVSGNSVQLVDYGLSVPVSRQPSRVMQDLSKIGGLVNWGNPELASDPYVSMVNRYLDRYKEIQGHSKAAKNKRTALGEQYIQELGRLQ